MSRIWLLFGIAAGLAASPAEAAKKNVQRVGTVQSITGDTLTLKGYEEKADGSAANFEKKLKLTSDTKFVTVQGRGKKAEETTASRGDVRTGMKVAFTERDGVAEKIAIQQKGKKNK